MAKEDAIRERSYLIWESEGRPHGKELEHWARATAELTSETRTSPRRNAKTATPATGARAATRSKKTAAR